MMMMWEGALLVLTATVAVKAQISFEGCFAELQENKGESFDFEDVNLNEDCAHFCASRGFILSVTRGELCHCTTDFPNVLLVESFVENSQGANSPCNQKCPGVIQSRSCKGDECCGGRTEKGVHAYSVYAVDAIDPVAVLKSRIYNALRNHGDQMAWLREPIISECYNSYIEHRPPHGCVKLDLKRNQYTLKRSVASVSACQTLCNKDPHCKSISYFLYNRYCTTNRVSIVEAKTIPTTQQIAVYDRNCSFNVDMVPTSFQLDVLKHETLMVHQPAFSRVPLHNEDFELDLTNSNSWDTIRRSIAIHNEEAVTFSNEAGFEIGASMSISKQQSKTEQTSTTGSVSNTSTQGESYGYHRSTSRTSSAGFSFFGIGASISSTVTSGFSKEFSKSFSQTVAQSRTHGVSITEGVSATEGRSASSVFNRGYIKNYRADQSQTYEYSLTVPPLHKGTLNFLLEKRPLILKWKSILQVNGYVKIRMEDLVQELHVSRLLSAEERYLYTMGTMKYDRQLVVGKVTIQDKNGKVVENDSQLINRG